MTRSKPLKSWSLDTLSGQDLVSVQVVLTTTQRHGLELWATDHAAVLFEL